jgi:hypothetical protein
LAMRPLRRFGGVDFLRFDISTPRFASAWTPS